jgi:DNA adenine methylase
MYFHPTRSQVADWYNTRSKDARAPSNSEGTALDVYMRKKHLSREAALDELSTAFARACVALLKKAAKRGVLPPTWVRDPILLRGRNRYENLRKEAGTSVLVPGVRLGAPITWLGGKGQFAAHLLPLFPAHNTFVNPFGGGGSILFAKQRASKEVYNDIDWRTCNLLRVIQDPVRSRKLYFLATATLYSREEYEQYLIDELGPDDAGQPGKLPKGLAGRFAKFTAARQAELLDRGWHEGKRKRFSNVQLANRWLVLNRMNVNGLPMGDWRYSLGRRTAGEAGEKKERKKDDGAPTGKPYKGPAEAWFASVDEMPKHHARLQWVKVENLDWRKILEKYDGPGPSTFIYMEPPYVLGTRRAGRGKRALYAHEFADSEHEALVQALLGIRAHAIISGYFSKLYLPLEEAGWARFDRRWAVRTGLPEGKRKKQDQGQGPGSTRVKKTKRKPSIESIWVCPPLVDWVSFVAPAHKWRESKRGQPPPPVEELP